MENARIMVVEDERITATHIKEKLKDFGYEVTALVSDGEDAILKAGETRPDLVLMDIKLKGNMDGIEAAIELRKQFDIPVVYLTAFTDDEVLERAKVTEPLGYIVKPFGSAELQTTLEMALYKSEMERKLKHSEEKFRTLFNTSPEGVVLLGLDGIILEVNDSVETLTGLKKNELLGKSITELELFETKELAGLIEVFPKVIDGDFQGTLDLSIRTGSGTKWIEAFPSRLKKDNETYAIQVIVRDITDRRAIAEALRDSEEKFRLLFQNASEGIMYIDRSWNIIDVNPKVLEILGYDRHEIVGQNFRELLPAFNIDTSTIEAALQDVLTGPPQFKIEWELTNKRGDSQILLAHISLVKKYSEVVGISLILEDITKRRTAEEALRESKERYKTLLESISDSVYVLDRQWRHILVNDAAVEFVKIPKDRLLGSKLTELFPGVEETPFFKTFQRVMETRVPDKVTSEFAFEDQRMGWFEVNVYPVPEGILCISSDITERKMAEETVRASEEKYHTIFSNSPDYIYLTDFQGCILDANTALLNKLGLSLEEFQRYDILDFFAGESTNDLVKDVAKILAGEEIKGLEVKVQTLEGEQLELEVNAVPLMKSGEVIKVLNLARDITERKRAQEALRESEEKFRNLSEKSPNMIFINKGGRIVYANEKCQEVMGYTREELYSPDFDFMQLIVRESWDMIKERFSAHLKGEEVPPYEYSILTKRGKKIDAILTTKLIRYGGESAILGIITDITDRKRAEEALRKSEERYATILENINDALIIHDFSGNIYDVNDVACQLFGRPVNELIDMNLRDLISKEMAKNFDRNISELLNRGAMVFDSTARKPSGEVVPVNVSATVISKEGRGIVQAFTRDISVRKKAEEAFQRLAAIVESSDDAIIAKNLNGEILNWNKGAERIYGYSGEEVVGRLISILIPQDRPDELSFILEQIKNGESVDHYETQRLKKDGTTIDVSLTISPLRDENNEIIGASTIARDITEHKKAELAIKESEERFRELANLLPQTVFEIDLDGNVTYANQVGFECFGYDPEDLESGLNALDLFISEDRERLGQNIIMILQGNKLKPNEYTAMRSDGTKFPVLIYSRPIIQNCTPTGIRGIVVDITERKEVERQLIQSTKLASIGTLASGIAHEINNPLAGILGYAEIISEESNLDNIKRYADKIMNNAEQASRIVKWLSRYSRGAKDTNISDVDINQVIKDSIEALRHTRNMEGVNLVVDLQNIPDIRGNKNELQQVIVNLLGNAIDAVARMGKINLSTTTEDGFIEVSITDNGKGISKENLYRIFEPFFTTKDVGEGTGLGLYVVSMLIKKHQGEIWVDSKEGAGTTFKLTFPKGPS